MEETKHTSPRWGSTTKLIVGLTFVAIVAALMIQFHTIIGPLFLAFIFSYLLHPLAGFLSRKLRISWRAAVGIVFLFILLLLIGLLTVGGVGLVNQIQSLITVLQNSLEKLPELLATAASFGGRFGLDLAQFDISTISEQLLSFGQSLLSQMGSLLSSVAGSVASFLGWTLFVLLISFFVTAESGGLREDMLRVEIPGYAEDLRRLGHELGIIWNAFLRGQFIIFFATVAIYFVVLTILRVDYAIWLALAAGFARFVPYVGPAINWTVLVLVTFFQADKPFFVSQPLYYTLVVLVVALLIDQVFDNIVSPRILADALRVHPAAVLVAALIAANLLGVLGVVIAAPMLATLQLFGQYTVRKMFDLDPWPEPPRSAEPAGPKISLLTRLRDWWTSLAKPRRK
jgi:predicted PurR-regulated permease PerM